MGHWQSVVHCCCMSLVLERVLFDLPKNATDSEYAFCSHDNQPWAASGIRLRIGLVACINEGSCSKELDVPYVADITYQGRNAFHPVCCWSQNTPVRDRPMARPTHPEQNADVDAPYALPTVHLQREYVSCLTLRNKSG